MVAKKKTPAKKKAPVKKKPAQKAPAKAKPVKKPAVKKPPVKKATKAKAKPKPKTPAKKANPEKGSPEDLMTQLANHPTARPWVDRCSHIEKRDKAGNQAKKRKGVVGRPPNYEDANTLWDMCCEYFEYIQQRPLWETKLSQYKGQQVSMIGPKMAAMTLTGLQLFVGVNKDTWLQYQQRGKGFPEVCTQAEQIIYNQKFQGAAADQLNPAIIARDLGLADKKVVTGEDGNPLTMLISQLSGNTIGPKE